MPSKFLSVAKNTDPLRISLGLCGASGTGKTYTALRVARGLAEIASGKAGAPIGYVDTENRRALHYRDAFPEMMHLDLKATDDKGELVGFGPERWIEVLDIAEKEGLPVVVIDSFSHAWEGIGGVLDLHATVLDRLTRGDDAKRDQRSQLAWAEVKPPYRRLVDRIVRANCDVIVCTRAKPVMQARGKNARATKTRRADVPWDIAADGDLLFEMTAQHILDPSAPGCPVYQIKVADQFKTLFDPRKPMNEDTGRTMGEWARGRGDAQAEKSAMDQAREVARRGREAFGAWWNSEDGKNNRSVLRPILNELAEIASKADQAAADEGDDPFAAFDRNKAQEEAEDRDEEAALARQKEEEEQARQEFEEQRRREQGGSERGGSERAA